MISNVYDEAYKTERKFGAFSDLYREQSAKRMFHILLTCLPYYKD